MISMVKVRNYTSSIKSSLSLALVDVESEDDSNAEEAGATAKPGAVSFLSPFFSLHFLL
jgi:hypothetical protein